MTNQEQFAIVYCEGAFNTTNGKTAHGLVRFTRRYRVAAVIDSRHAGQDAGAVLDGKVSGIPVVGTLDDARESAHTRGMEATHFVVGIAPDGGRLSKAARADVAQAIQTGLNVDCGLHDFLSEDAELARHARERNVVINDVRRPPPRSDLHFFTGDIEEVAAFKIAVLGTDSAVGKRTTAWKIVEGFGRAGKTAEMIGTGQTAWMQGVAYGVIMDSLINDFLTGEIEHAIVSAWREKRPDVIVLEGQGSLLNPAYPGGYELIAAGRPDVIVLQHAPAREVYDGFPDYPLHTLATQIEALEIIAQKPVVAITVNHEDLTREELPHVCRAIERITGLPAIDVLVDGPERLVSVLNERMMGRAS